MTRSVILPLIGTVAAWRSEARRLLRAGIPAEDLLWRVEGSVAAPDLFAGQDGAVPETPGPSIRMPKTVLHSLETALHHRYPERFARAYDLVLRLSRASLRWGDRADPAMLKLLEQEKAVRRDQHKMHAFVRFREIGDPTAPRRAFAAWFEPDHPITELAAPFFARRFGDMDWIIATPHLTARCLSGMLAFEPTNPTFRPPPDDTEALWRTYFASIFNPARLMVSAMMGQMPRKYWKNLPETQLIPELIRSAPARARAMQEAAPTLPPAHVDRLKAKRAKQSRQEPPS